MNKYQYLFILTYLLILAFGMASVKADNINKMKIYNPTRYDISLEIKCNWSNEFKKFKYHNFYTLYGNKSVNIIVPQGRCQLWPGLK